MTISLNRTTAGRRAPHVRISSPSAVAVWEPSGYREAAAEQRVVRTLRISDRTERRGEELESVRTNPGPTKKTVSLGRRSLQAFGTYLLGAVFGVCVVTAALSQSGTDSTPGAIDTGYSYSSSPAAAGQ
ncbi:hypothetical protein [Corynebacterium atrinae]|uniref:hypothetical protein n=1 Tax=Corynebacterium atrinae TaxID=1336740 RepID=UPI0025B2FBD0|nr:hypothetical protein [Corynebacterium atrinae]